MSENLDFDGDPETEEQVTEHVDVTEARVWASEKIQLQDYEPFEAGAELSASFDSDLPEDELDEALDVLSNRVAVQVTRVAEAKMEARVRAEAFGDDD